MTMVNTIGRELRLHAPFTALGALSGILIMALVIRTGMSREASSTLFWIFHPLHVFLSALVTAGIYRRHGVGSVWWTLLVGYVGSVGIATLSDSVIPFMGEALMGFAHREIHLGVIEKWWLVNPLAFAGVTLACIRPYTKISHAAHVLLSTWASLFHMTMAMGAVISVSTFLIVVAFLFLAVWLPCCTSDIVFPLLAAGTVGQQTVIKGES